MSQGNRISQGGKGTNYPYQSKVLKGLQKSIDELEVIVANTLPIAGLATEATLALLESKLNTLGQKVSASSAPVVLSTEQEVILTAIQTAVENLDMDVDALAKELTLQALLTAFNAEDFATQTTLAELLVELQLKADLSETQPVSAATLPLPTGASTEATLSNIDISLNPLTRTPNILRTTAAGTIAPAIYDFSVFNAGLADGVFLGAVIRPGETFSYAAGALNNIYTAGTISYDGTGTELIIAYNS